MNFEKNKNIVKDAVTEASVAIFLTVLLMTVAWNIVLTPKTTILLFNLAILAALATPLLIMGYPSIKTFSVEVKAILSAVIFFTIFLSQTNIIPEVKKILSEPIIELALIVCALLAIWSLKGEHEMETSNGTIYVRDYDLMKPFIAPGVNILILVAALVWLNPSLELGFEETVSILYAAIVAIAYSLFIPLIKRRMDDTIKLKPNPV